MRSHLSEFRTQRRGGVQVRVSKLGTDKFLDPEGSVGKLASAELNQRANALA